MKKVILFFVLQITFVIHAQHIQFLDLPSFFDREFEISGLTGNRDNLFLAAERCEKIFVVKKEDMTHVETIHLNTEKLKSPIEIEGLTLYKNFLLIADEKKGRVLSYNLTTHQLKVLPTNGKDLSSLTGKYGMEGIVVNEKSGILYVLREKNEKNQSEIHTFAISEIDGLIELNYLNHTIIQHENSDWRYAGLSIDYINNRLLCLKSCYVEDWSALNKREIDYIKLDACFKSTQFTYPNTLLSLSKDVLFMKKTYATNIEGIYCDSSHIYITSDNGEGEKDCSQISSKTAMIRIELK